MLRTSLFLLLLPGLTVCLPALKFPHNPVILVPGNGGSQLWARLNDTRNHWYCQRSTGSSAELLWLQLSNLVYPAVKCLAYNLMLRKQTAKGSPPPTFENPGTTQDNVGVESFVPGFGSLGTMLWISDFRSKYTAYYATLAQRLIDKHGFADNFTVRGAPYDFRKAPDEFDDYFLRMKSLIEETYFASGGKRVVLVAHSMGGKLVLHFLQAQSQGWKDKYIEHFVAAGAAFGGVPSSLLALLSGYSLGIPLIKPIWFRPVQRSWPSTHYLLPDPAVYPEDGPPLVIAPDGAAYTVANLSALFARIGYPEGFADAARLSRLTDVGQPPGVAVTCVFGAGLETPGQLRWGSRGFPDAQPSEVGRDSGDGTVSAATARVCRGWRSRQNASVTVSELSGAQHVAMLSDERFVGLVARLAIRGDN